jgi:hypothetical protein
MEHWREYNVQANEVKPPELVNLIVEIILKTYAKFNFICQSLFHVAIQSFINCHS